MSDSRIKDENLRFPPLPDNIWLLLDTPSVPGMAAEFKNRFADSSAWDELLANTDMHLIRDQGPMLVHMTPCNPFSLTCSHELHDWPGLWIVCSATRQELLAHLRRMLIVRFSDHYKSLLSYYNVQTASYFFDAMDPRELSRWLGPIESITWFGGPWSDKVDNTEGRQFVINPRLDVSPLTDEPELSPTQEKKLQQCLLERHAYFWSRTKGSNYRRTLSHLHEGLHLGFNDTTLLDEWLALRARFPSALVPSNLPGDSQQARFKNLAGYWQGGQL